MLTPFPLDYYGDKKYALPILESGINIGVHLLFFEKIWRKCFLWKNDHNALIDVKINLNSDVKIFTAVIR